MHWGFKKSAKYVSYHRARLVVCVRRPEWLILAKDAQCNVQIRAAVLDLRAYGVEFESCGTEWDIQGYLGMLL